MTKHGVSDVDVLAVIAARELRDLAALDGVASESVIPSEGELRGFLQGLDASENYQGARSHDSEGCHGIIPSRDICRLVNR